MSGLRRFVAPTPLAAGPAPGETCELCGEALTGGHTHAVDLDDRKLVCTCRACRLLLGQPGAGRGRYKTVPDEHHRVGDVPAALWAALGIPVGVTFLLRAPAGDGVVAFYPSPGGATESLLDLDAWDAVVRATPALGEIEPDVQAVLARSRAGGVRCWIVPVDRCYELVAELRLRWKGFDGGTEVRDRIEAFFADVEQRCEAGRA